VDEPKTRSRSAIRLLQLLPGASNPESDPGDGSGNYRPYLDHTGTALGLKKAHGKITALRDAGMLIEPLRRRNQGASKTLYHETCRTMLTPNLLGRFYCPRCRLRSNYWEIIKETEQALYVWVSVRPMRSLPRHRTAREILLGAWRGSARTMHAFLVILALITYVACYVSYHTTIGFGIFWLIIVPSCFLLQFIGRRVQAAYWESRNRMLAHHSSQSQGSWVDLLRHE
jgi:hypothetical protein